MCKQLLFPLPPSVGAQNHTPYTNVKRGKALLPRCVEISWASPQRIPAVGISAFWNISLGPHLCHPTETPSCSNLPWVWHVFRAFSLSSAQITGLCYLHDTSGEIIVMPSVSLGAQTQWNQSLNGEQRHTNGLLVFSWFCARMDCPVCPQCIFYWDIRFSFSDRVPWLTHLTSPLNFSIWLLYQHASY